ncbi:unnamed protein product [Acanthosepion pharaonis]|uniref:Uncharacterized protein n=1 Tax=Acanthosepion pharaonis TaxID=158019 RepID=A0A812EBL7_ACAPH|nr:unnamed protein product [Sepia pharaonis]
MLCTLSCMKEERDFNRQAASTSWVLFSSHFLSRRLVFILFAYVSLPVYLHLSFSLSLSFSFSMSLSLYHWISFPILSLSVSIFPRHFQFFSPLPLFLSMSICISLSLYLVHSMFFFYISPFYLLSVILSFIFTLFLVFFYSPYSCCPPKCLFDLPFYLFVFVFLFLCLGHISLNVPVSNILSLSLIHSLSLPLSRLDFLFLST